jgi:RNA-binding protein
VFAVRFISPPALSKRKEGDDQMPPRTKKDVMHAAVELKPTVHVGKDGVTESLVQEVKQQVKLHKVIKIRLLPAAGEDKKAVAMSIAEQATVTMVDLRGSIVTVCQKRYFGG